jgi:MoxR-like ATPase
VTAPRAVLRTIREELQQMFLERSELIDGALIALLAGQHVLVVGPPGTAKSMLADEVCRRLNGARYFQWLLTRFTTPEELFGAVSLAALEQDDYRRMTTHKLPEAHVAFLDEIFKASSSILNTILSVMNERRFHNGRVIETVPLLTLFAAANELPEDDELLALQDRFLLRFMVGYIDEDFRFLKLLQGRAPATRTVLDLDTLEQARQEAAAVAVPGEVLRLVMDLRRALGAKDIIASDRRWMQAIGLLRAHAYLDGRDVVGEADLRILEHVLWRDPAERETVREAIREQLHGYEDEVRVLLYQSRELRDYALRDWGSEELRSRATVEAHTKLRNILTKVDAIVTEAEGGGRVLDQATAMRDEIAQIQRELLGRV